MGTAAKIIADVISPRLDRLTIMEATFHRFVLAEVNTHRSHSRSSASSRAIPVEKMLQRAIDEPAWPVMWASEQPGMQGGDELTGDDLAAAQDLLRSIASSTTRQIENYLRQHPDKSTRLHKSLLNRPMEWFQYHTVIIGATDEGWANFFAQRATNYSPLAQPELRAVVDLMFDLYQTSEPTPLGFGEWVTPYIQPDEDFPIAERARHNDDVEMLERREISSARCARVSYLTHENVRDPIEDVRLFTKLADARPMHAAPLEFVATPLTDDMEPMGNFTGYRQFRHIVQGMVDA